MHGAVPHVDTFRFVIQCVGMKDQFDISCSINETSNMLCERVSEETGLH